MTGETVSHYEILEELGRGGMGVVYKARDTHLDRFVALKFLPPFLTRDEAARDRFIREAKAAAAIEHNHICTIHDIAESEDGRTYIVMSYYSGQALNDRIAHGPIPIKDAIRYGAQAASALAAAHAAGIAHRDIKPGNLILTDADEIKLVDFGLAKLAGQVDLTKSRSTVGTAAYMSPEQVKGDRVDHRTDLWSLGIVLYEMVAGRRPFQGEYEQALSYAIVNVEPPELKTEDSLSTALDRLIREKLLDKEVENRSASAEEIADELQQMLTEESGQPESPGVSVRAPASRVSRVVGPVLLAVLLLTAAILWLNRGEQSSVERPVDGNVTRIAVLPFSVRGSGEYESMGDGLVDLLSATIDGTGDWHSVDPRWVFSASSDFDMDNLDPSSARDLANELSASLFVLGNIVEVGGRLRVDAAIYPVDGSLDPVGSGEVEGNADNLFELVDRLASQLLLNPEIGSSERLRDLAELTTNSVDALKAYLEGESAFRDFDFIRSINALQRAVEIDSSFALAWYRLSVVADWITWSRTAVEAARQAVRHGQNVSDRDRKLFDALLANRTGDMATAERLYREILLRDPNDSEALYNLGELLFHDAPYEGRPYEHSRVVWQQLFDQEPNSITSLIHLARVALYLDERDNAMRLVDKVLAESPEGDRNPEFLAYKFILTNDPADFEVMMAALRTLDASNLATTMAALNFYETPLEPLLKVFDIFTVESEGVSMPTWGYAWRSQLLLAHGRLAESRHELERTKEVDPDRGLAYEVLTAVHPLVGTTETEYRNLLSKLAAWHVDDVPPSSNPIAVYSAFNNLYPTIKTYLTGLVASELGDEDLVKQMIDQLQNMDESNLINPIHSALIASLRARLLPAGSVERLAELERAFPRAWFQFRMGSPMYTVEWDRYERAQILQGLGRHEEAVNQLESLRRGSPSEYAYHVPGLVLQARSFVALGQTEKARTVLQRFLRLWEKADPEFGPFLDEARELLESID